jgi:hypothetical protein
MWFHLCLHTETHNYWVVRTDLPKIIKCMFVSKFPGCLLWEECWQRNCSCTLSV